MEFSQNMLVKLSLVVSIVMLSFFSVFTGSTKAEEFVGFESWKIIINKNATMPSDIK
ncbi:hypothetical protein [Viridibacillus arvi]|uniref:hypothetical protein n=1 Tax=Viridibacillus arvi TaxID=263475 RepID=UPI003D2E00BC